MAHLYGIEPEGNHLLRGGPNIRSAGLGMLQVMSDHVLLNMLHMLSPVALGRLAVVSKALYCFCGHEELWKAACLAAMEHSDSAAAATTADNTPASTADCTGAAANNAAAENGSACRFRWHGTWRDSYVACFGGGRGLCPGPHKPLQVKGMYSDLLYQPWFCATVELSHEWLEVDNVDRRHGLSLTEFQLQYEHPNRPVILTDVVPTWPAASTWTRQYLAEALGHTDVIVGNMPMPFDAYLDYCDNNSDEMPLYLFDKHFVDKAPQLGKDYTVPEHFAQDLFSVLGDRRPDYRWLIMGPARSGSSFHVDPNSTSAWNAVISGAKKWLLFPPGCTPPGVHPSADGADVATPLSIIEWFLNFYDEAREAKPAPLECTVRAGELLFVPRGWWHCAINLEESIAITQNYVSDANLGHVLAFLRSRSAELVSGCAVEDRTTLHERFVAALRTHCPDVLAAAEEQEARKQRDLQQQQRLSQLFKDSRPQNQQQQQVPVQQLGLLGRLWEQQQQQQQQQQEQQQKQEEDGCLGWDLHGLLRRRLTAASPTQPLSAGSSPQHKRRLLSLPELSQGRSPKKPKSPQQQQQQQEEEQEDGPQLPEQAAGDGEAGDGSDATGTFVAPLPLQHSTSFRGWLGSPDREPRPRSPLSRQCGSFNFGVQKFERAAQLEQLQHCAAGGEQCAHMLQVARQQPGGGALSEQQQQLGSSEPTAAGFQFNFQF